MVNGDNKYWFENEDKEKSEMPAAEIKGEDLFGFGEAPKAQESAAYSVGSVPSAPEEPAPYDPHERHYQSEFSRRGTVPPADLNGEGKIKAVRGRMLNKLLKYDFRALFKFLIPCYVVLVALAVLCAICLPIAEHVSDSQSNNLGATAFFTALSSIVFFYALGVLCCSTVCIFNIALRFQKNLFSGEGYLTLSIPATPEEHILSKSISGFVAIVLTVLVAVGSLLIVAAPYGSQIFPKIGELLGNLGILYRDYTVDAVFLTIELVLFLLFYVIFNIQVIYSCMCVGHLCVNKSRGGAAAVAFVIYIAVSQTISVFFTATGALGSFFNSQVGAHLFFWILILLQGGGAVGLFFFQRHVLKQKVNLG